MKQLARMLGVAALLVLSACGGSDGPTDPDEEDDENSFTASVGTTQFTGQTFSNPVRTGNRVSFWVNQVVGAQAHTHRFEFNLDPITAPGNIPVGVGATSYVTYMEVGTGGVTNYWRTSLTGGAGSVNVTTLTSSRIAGNFSVIVGPDRNATGTKTITGSFDIYSE